MKPWMAYALEIGRCAIGTSRPNPAVGAVVVKNGSVCAKGQTQSPGSFHAEVMALQTASENAKDADLYVTLEPCCHYGRTPPCTEAIIASGIKRVFFAHKDPNPLVRNKSRQILEKAGIEVFEGLEACQNDKELFAEIEHFFEAYDYFVSNKFPFIELKLAVSADGFIALNDYTPVAITHSEANKKNHRLRSYSDAILVSSRTALLDNPSLDVRHVEGNSPIKIIFGLSTILPKDLKLFSKGKTIVFSQNLQEQLKGKAEIVLLPSENFKENWLFMLKYLADLGMHRLMVEPGKILLEEILKSGIWNKFHLWRSNKFLEKGIDVPFLNSYLKTPQEIISLKEDTLHLYKNNSFKL
jgi:diaminohydroxyphosphoribosylaminopyrimidine deaminase/5-amino-6-(5-phosphoribosylamino)uracil reductase